ncbi:MAG: hypothetical protein L0H26_00245 [Microlunatus sp.]|nr:hypothetical protein [Microlunatus sp.]
MYPVIVHRLADLRAEDRIVARSGQRYGKPLRVLDALGPIEPGSPIQGVRVVNPNPDSLAEWVLYPSQMDGQQLEVDRPKSSRP